MLDLLQFGPNGWGDEIAYGLIVTISLALLTLPFGLSVGFVIAIMRNSKKAIPRALGEIYSTIFRSLPELLTLFLVYYGGQILLQKFVNLFSADAYVEVNSFFAGAIALGFVFAAYASEVFLGALRAITKGQTEAASALGLKRLQVLWLVVVPQLWQYALPGLANLWLVLLKDTSLVSIIALNDLMRRTNIAVGSTKEPFFFYAIACLIYLTMSIVSGIVISRIEAKTTNWGEAGAR